MGQLVNAEHVHDLQSTAVDSVDRVSPGFVREDRCAGTVGLPASGFGSGRVLPAVETHLRQPDVVDSHFAFQVAQEQILSCHRNGRQLGRATRLVAQLRDGMGGGAHEAISLTEVVGVTGSGACQRFVVQHLRHRPRVHGNAPSGGDPQVESGGAVVL